MQSELQVWYWFPVFCNKTNFLQNDSSIFLNIKLFGLLLKIIYMYYSCFKGVLFSLSCNLQLVPIFDRSCSTEQ